MKEKFIGNVVNGQAARQCVTKPLGINILQDFEADTVYTFIMPKIVKVGRRWKWSY